MHLAKMWNQDGHLLRHGTTCEKQTSQVRLESSAAAGSFIHSKNTSFFPFRKQTVDEDLEGEEEFYYNEIEVPLNGEFITLAVAAAAGSGFSVSASNAATPTLFSTSAPPSSAMLLPSTLADHMDMARPPHENPEYNFAHHNRNFAALRPSPAHSQPPRRNPAHLASYPPPPPPPPQPSAFSSITAAVPIAIPVTSLAFARSAVSNLG